MARLNFQVGTEGEVSCVAATLKTVLLVIAPTNQRVAVTGWHISFDGATSGNQPIRVQLQRLTSNGTTTSVTPRKQDDDIATAIQSTAGKNASAEPTKGDILKNIEVHPQNGYEEHRPFDRPYIIGGGDRIGIVVTAPDTVNCEAWLDCEE